MTGRWLPVQDLPAGCETMFNGWMPRLGLYCVGPAAAAAAAPTPTAPLVSKAAALSVDGSHLAVRTAINAGAASPSPVGISPNVQRLRQRKKQATSIYLDTVEKQTDSFLNALGVAPDAVPDHYLDVPPTIPAMRQIALNADLLHHCAQEVFNPSSAIRRQLIEPLVSEVWSVHLDPLLEALLTHRQSFVAAGDAVAVSEVDQDVAHLSEMRTLESTFLTADDEAEGSHNGGAAPRVGLSDVVPIAGLSVGRVHRLLQEQRTVLEHWTPQRREEYEAAIRQRR
jgi:hypothetical protein